MGLSTICYVTSPTTTSLDILKIIYKTNNQENANLTQWRKSSWIHQKVLHKISNDINVVDKELLFKHNCSANICQHTEIFNVDNNHNNIDTDNTDTENNNYASCSPCAIIAYFPHPWASDSNCPSFDRIWGCHVGLEDKI